MEIPFAAELVLKLFFLVIILFIAFVVHELGHFIAARIFGIDVKTVEIGRGRKIFGRTDKRGARWSIGVVPFGAHVNLDAGEGGGFFTRPYWQRALTIAAGPLVNLALPFILFTGFYVLAGQPSTPPVVVGVAQGLPAEEAGIRPGDRVLAVNGRDVLNFRDIWEEAYTGNAVESVFKIDRDGEIHDIAVTPLWADYMDDGIRRQNPRFGILWTHTPFKFDALRAINGEAMNGDDHVRKTLLANMGRQALIDLKSTDGEAYNYYFRPLRKVNPDIENPESRYHKLVYLGPTRDNFYLRQPVAAQFHDALKYAANRIGQIALLPFQLLPIDVYALQDEDAVGLRESAFRNYSYNFIHGLAVASILIGLINLLPLPYLDGGHIVVQGIEAARRKPMTRKAKAWLFGWAFLGLYLSVLHANIDNVPHYIDSRLKKVHEFINQKE